MNKRTITIISLLLFIFLAGMLLTSCGSGNSSQATSSAGSSDGQTLLQERCSVCHSTDRVTSAQKTADQWATTVDRMVSHGAQLTTQEKQTLVDYLAANYK
jgi:mono/diheme cytochrome c family protein